VARRISPAWRSRDCLCRCPAPDSLPLGASPCISRESCKDSATPTLGCAETRQQNKIKDLDYPLCGPLPDDRPRTLRSFGGVRRWAEEAVRTCGGRWLALQARVGGLWDAEHPRSPLACPDRLATRNVRSSRLLTPVKGAATGERGERPCRGRRGGDSPALWRRTVLLSCCRHHSIRTWASRSV
jgi:hypothetical protein